MWDEDTHTGRKESPYPLEEDLSLEEGDGALARRHDGVEIHLHHGAEVLLGHPVHHPGEPDAGVVYDGEQPPLALLGDAREGRVHLRGLGHVQLEGDELACVLGGCRWCKASLGIDRSRIMYVLDSTAQPRDCRDAGTPTPPQSIQWHPPPVNASIRGLLPFFPSSRSAAAFARAASAAMPPSVRQPA